MSELLGQQLWAIALRWQRELNRALSADELSHRQYLVLDGIDRLCTSCEHVTQAAVAHCTRGDVMTTSSVVRALCARGLVDRVAHPSDSRARALTLTSAGVQVLVRARAAAVDVDLRLFGSSVPPEVAAFLERVPFDED